MDNQDYPVKYIRSAKLSDGTIIQLRPIHPSDGQYAETFKASLSQQSLNSRFFGPSPKITKSIIKKYTDLDYSTEMAIVAEIGTNFEKEVIGIARIAPHTINKNDAEYGVIISDKRQGKGLGNILTNYLIRISKEMGYKHLYAYTYSDNIRMIEILKSEGFTLKNEDYQTIEAKIKL